MLYEVVGYIPAISKVMVAGGWHFTRFVLVAGVLWDAS
jgi:hypothetical protein